jgi:formamidopyrimidine-DNA glycosylase
MPELPEVETLRCGLDPVLSGHRIVRVEQRRKDLRFPFPDGFARRMAGRTVINVARRAKYLLFHLDGAEVLAVHLGMTGRFTVTPPGATTPSALGQYAFAHGADRKHDHVVFTLSGGTTVTYNDARRFGYMALIAEAGLAHHAYFAGLGIEPLGAELTAGYLAMQACGKRTDLKSFLMDQRIVAGLGNIYVCEALFRARLHPFTPAARLATKKGTSTLRAARMVAAIRAVLLDALHAGGSTLRDYQHADGSRGRFQNEFAVYGRDGQACSRPRCRGIVRRQSRGGRSTFYCPACQR